MLSAFSFLPARILLDVVGQDGLPLTHGAEGQAFFSPIKGKTKHCTRIVESPGSGHPQAIILQQ
jgi:hypothetical protein